LLQFLHYLLEGCAENPLYFVEAEGTPRRVVRTVLKVPNVDNLIILALLGSQSKEPGAVQAVCCGVEVVAKELEELS